MDLNIFDEFLLLLLMPKLSYFWPVGASSSWHLSYFNKNVAVFDSFFATLYNSMFHAHSGYFLSQLVFSFNTLSQSVYTAVVAKTRSLEQHYSRTPRLPNSIRCWFLIWIFCAINEHPHLLRTYHLCKTGWNNDSLFQFWMYLPFSVDQRRNSIMLKSFKKLKIDWSFNEVKVPKRYSRIL